MEFLKGEPSFETTKTILNQPLEITRAQLRLMNMMDENIEVHEDAEIYHDTE